MDVISMVKISSLISQLKRDYPQFNYRKSTVCSWEPHSQTVLYSSHADPAYILHEMGHALLNHDTFEHDVSLLSIERAAWMYAKHELATSYTIHIPDAIIEDSIDTYRDWIHKRSLCPHCGVNGIQQTKTTYSCAICNSTWKVNDARSCQLRRTVIHTY